MKNKLQYAKLTAKNVLFQIEEHSWYLFHVDKGFTASSAPSKCAKRYARRAICIYLTF